VERSEPINFGMVEVPKITIHATKLDPEETNNFKAFIRECKINCVWTYVDMLGLDIALMVYHLEKFPRAKPIKQKLQKMHLQIMLLVKVELNKVLYFNFIRSINYPNWVKNLFLVSKPTVGIRICNEFRDLNNYCSKDNLPLPSINKIVDLIVGYEMLSSMDDFLGYNHIIIALKDQHKTTFTCGSRNFC
jgi:hypothetical protein